jgi:hypothetical protein
MRGRGWRWLLGGVLIAVGGASIGRGAVNALRPEQSQDLAPVYKAARLWRAGDDPYQPVDPETWRTRTHAEDAPDVPVGADVSTIYSPIAVMDVALASDASWRGTKVAWLGLNIALAVYVPVLVWALWYREWSPVLRWLAGGLWLGGMGLRIGLGNGQHTLLWLATILTACALIRSWPRAAGAALAMSLHKFNLTAVVAPYFLARRAFVTLGSAAACAMAAWLVFVASSHVPASSVAASYVREFTWLFGQSRGGTLPGHGVTDVYGVVAGLAGDGAVASVLTFMLALAGLAVTAAVTDRSGGTPRDVDVAAWLLLLLWTTYHRAYDTVLFVVPLAALIERLRRSPDLWRSWGAGAWFAVLTLMWYVDPSKVYLVLRPAALDRIPASGALSALEMTYRMAVLALWAAFVSLAHRERGAVARSIRARDPGGSGRSVPDNLWPVNYMQRLLTEPR